MRIVKQWRDGSRKRAAADDDDDGSDQESLRKRTKSDSIDNAGVRPSEIGKEGNQEYKIRGTSNINNNNINNNNRDLLLSSSHSPTFTPLATESPRSSPSIHPDRLDNILNADPDHPHAPAVPLSKRVNPLTLLPQAQKKHISRVESEGQRRK